MEPLGVHVVIGMHIRSLHTCMQGATKCVDDTYATCGDGLLHVAAMACMCNHKHGAGVCAVATASHLLAPLMLPDHCNVAIDFLAYMTIRYTSRAIHNTKDGLIPWGFSTVAPLPTVPHATWVQSIDVWSTPTLANCHQPAWGTLIHLCEHHTP
jgi:hypothetical protein